MQMRLAAAKKDSRLSPPDDAPELEETLQDEIVAYCHAKGWWVLWSRMDLKTTTPLGSPDLVIFADKGRIFTIEAKSATGKIRPAQLGVKLKLEMLGHTVHIVRSMTEFINAIST